MVAMPRSAANRLLDYLIILIVGLAGYADGPAWFVLVGAGGLTIEEWWRQLNLLRRHPSVPWSSKITTYFVTGVVSNLFFAALAFWFGMVMRLALD